MQSDGGVEIFGSDTTKNEDTQTFSLDIDDDQVKRYAQLYDDVCPPRYVTNISYIRNRSVWKDEQSM